MSQYLTGYRELPSGVEIISVTVNFPVAEVEVRFHEWEEGTITLKDIETTKTKSKHVLPDELRFEFADNMGLHEKLEIGKSVWKRLKDFDDVFAGSKLMIAC